MADGKTARAAKGSKGTSKKAGSAKATKSSAKTAKAASAKKARAPATPATSNASKAAKRPGPASSKARAAAASGRGASERAARAARRKEPTFPIAYVKYHDHCWLESKELARIETATPYVVEESGFLIVENAKYVTLAKERSTDGEKGKVQYDDVTIIMRSDILDFRVFPIEPAVPKRTSTVRRRPRSS